MIVINGETSCTKCSCQDIHPVNMYQFSYTTLYTVSNQMLKLNVYEAIIFKQLSPVLVVIMNNVKCLFLPQIWISLQDGCPFHPAKSIYAVTDNHVKLTCILKVIPKIF